MNITDDFQNLRPDCENCFGLCCVALPFASSADFAVDKAAGKPCDNLQADFRCGVHHNLRQLGYRGCTVFDCFGAGQKVSQVTFNGNSWREDPDVKDKMFHVFPIMRQLHEMLWYINEAMTLPEASKIHEELLLAKIETEQLTLLSGDAIMKLDIAEHRATVNELLLKTSELVRSKIPQKLKYSKIQKKVGRGADLIGANLKGTDLIGVDLRGAYLIAADLRGADMRVTDLIGADFRDANISGANLLGSIFLTQAQVNSAKGDKSTKLPPTLMHPAHWN